MLLQNEISLLFLYLYKCDYWTDTQMDRQTDTGQSDPYVPLYFAGDTKRIFITGNGILFSSLYKLDKS